MVLTELELNEMGQGVEEDYRQDLETLDRMRGLIRRLKERVPLPTPGETVDSHRTIKDRIDGYILGIIGQFTMQSAWKMIREADPRFGRSLNQQTVSTALWRLHKDGKIKVVSPKKGKSAAIYLKADLDQATPKDTQKV